MRRRAGLLFASAAILLPVAAEAQLETQTVEPSTPPATDPDLEDDTLQEPEAQRLEPIVITARKTAETLQDAPIAVSAFTSESLEDKEIRDVASLANFTPGLSFSQAFGRSGDRPIIRGLSNVLAGVQFGVESGTSIFLDGALFRGDIQTINFDSIERVEVVKGPQSALYGRNTYAGAINIITKTPGNFFDGFVKGRAAEHDEYEVTAGFDIPVLPDLLSLRVDGRYFEYGGEYVNQLTGERLGSEQSYGGSVTAFATPTPDISLRLRGQYTEDDDGPQAFFLQPANENNCQAGFRSVRFRQVGLPFAFLGETRRSDNPNQYFCGVIEPRPELVALNTAPANGLPDGTAFDGLEVERLFTTATVDWDIGGSGWTVTAIGAYRDETQRFGTDSDFSNAYVVFGPPGVVEPLFANTDIEEFEDYSAEVRLSTPEAWPVRGLIGAYYYDFEERGRDITFQSGKDGVEFGTGGPGNDFFTIENKAVFGRIEADVTDSVTVGVEARYFDETKTLTEFFDDGGVTYPEFQSEDFTPRVTVDWQPDEDTLLYAIYAEGQKPGGINGASGIQAGTPVFRDETLKGGELGIKKSLIDNTLQVNLSVYYNDVEDVQLTTSIPDTAGTSAVTSIATNQGNAEVFGLELEIQAAPTDDLRVGLTYTYIDAKFTSGCDEFEYTLNTGGLRPTFNTENPPPEALPLCSIEGNRLPLGSPHQATVAADYTPMLTNDLDLVTNLNLTFEDSKFVQVHNLAETGTTTLVNGRIGVAGENWQIAAYGRNLFDEDTVPLATRWFDLRHGFTPRDIPFGQLAAQGQVADTGLPRAFFVPLRKGRQFGVELQYRF